jgi:plastocyanin
VNENLVTNVNVNRFLAAIIVLFVAAVAATQVFTVKAATVRNFTLYGSYSSGNSYTPGWGFTATNITSPGPTIVVEQGDTVNLTLTSYDGLTHSFFVSYTNSSSPDQTRDPWSDDFWGGKAVNFQFVATNTVGTYVYHCYYHPDAMWGYFKVVPTGTIPELHPLIMLSLLIAGTAAALVCRRKKQV